MLTDSHDPDCCAQRFTSVLRAAQVDHLTRAMLSAFVTAAVLLPSAFALPAVPNTVLEGAFPADFDFGTSTSSYQVEGGWLDGGKGLSIWDAYSHIPGMIANGDTGDVANDMYHLYPSDIKIMAEQGLHHYRFSIAWNRIMPTGVAPVNQQAVDYYNDLINQLLAHGVEPHVTLYHSETPLALTLYPNLPMPFMDSECFPSWYGNYTDVAFSLFGDRVKHWFTFNEPFCTSVYGTYGDTVSGVS
jgi:beta-glucosidase/6-phospho-beta-glucosidase/beta-galactosidase